MRRPHPDPCKDATLLRAASHPARRTILRLLGQRSSLTATEAVDEIEGPPGSPAGFNYHLRVLGGYELVEPVGGPTERGQRYRLTHRGHLALEALDLEEGGP